VAVVTLTTDFGLRDPYVAEMKGVILRLAPETRLVDITHDVDSHDVVGAALVLEAAVPFFPPAAFISWSSIPAWGPPAEDWR
jgi:S-adenosylmethionine hydrolase